MEYLDYLKSLSCGDPAQQIPSISRTVWAIKEQPSFILVNTIAITMAIEFTKATNRVRFFIAEFFRQCCNEMCLIRNKEDFFRHLTSILDVNNPVAQQLMLKILGYLAPLLTDMLEVHHKVLIAIETGQKLIRDTIFSILPSLITYCPSIAKHIFEKNIPAHYVYRICSVLPDQQDIIKKAYVYVITHFGDNRDIFLQLALRSRSFCDHAKRLFIKTGDIGRVQKLCGKYGLGILNDDEKVLLKTFVKEKQQIEVLNNFELLNQASMNGNTHLEQHYKYIYEHWSVGDKFSWIISRLSIPEEAQYCYKLLYKLRTPSTYLLNIQPPSLHLAKCLIRGGWHSSMYDHIFALNNWEQYQCACEMMTQGLHSEALTVFLSIKQSLKSENESVYNWLSGLIHICSFEKNKAGNLNSFYFLGCLDQSEKVYFHQEFFLSRYLLVQALNDIISGSVSIESLLKIRSRFEKLLYLFEAPTKDTIKVLKMWRDISGLLSMVLTCILKSEDFSYLLSKFYSVFSGAVPSNVKTPQHLGRIVLEYPVKYPKQFFLFSSPICLNLQVNCAQFVKVNRGSEFIVEVAVNVKKNLRKGGKVLVSLVNLGRVGREELYLSRESVVNAAGVCSLNIPVMINVPGVVQFRIVASVLNEYGREIGKPEFSVLTFECI